MILPYKLDYSVIGIGPILAFFIATFVIIPILSSAFETKNLEGSYE